MEMHPCEVKQSSLPSTVTFGGQLCCFGGSALLLVPSATLRCDASWLQQGFVSLAASDDLRSISERTKPVRYSRSFLLYVRCVFAI